MDPATLVAGLAAGDEAAWREFIQSYGGLIYAVASKLDLSDEKRDDLFQETCLKALASIQTLKNPERLASWIYTIAYRLGVDALRRERPEIVVEDFRALAEEHQSDNEHESPLRRLARLEEVAHLFDALDALDDKCSNLLMALYLEEPRPSYEEISARAGMPVGSIGPTRARCLQRLENLLDRLSNDTPGPSA